ncbi:MAG: hypothetical protein Q8P72_03500, partial [Candidatus Roizmanbacteria bacterium]|nr:hypothetical protein [Candidatus Roizmanbacteria bacterium]
MRNNFSHIQNEVGQSLIELLIVIGLLAILLPAITAGLITSREGKPQQEQRIHAAQLMKESQEVMRSIREASWSNIETNGTYHPTQNGTAWTLTAGPEVIDGLMTRQIEIEDVQRDGNNQIVTSSGSVDPSTKKITTTLSWNVPIITSTSSTMYLTRYLDNTTYIQTTEAEFNAGTLSDVIVTNTAGGEVTLGSGGSGSWCAPSLAITALDLPKSGVANAVTAIEGEAFAVTGDNASGVAFANIDISNADPPVASIRSTFDGYKTNDIFGEENYAYIATDTNNKDVVIIDISTSTPFESGSFDGSGPTNADAIFVSGSVGYMTQGLTLRTFDLSSKSGARPELDSVNLAGTGKAIFVSGDYVYVAVENSSSEFQIVDATNPSDISIISSTNLDSSGVSDIVVNETATRAYFSASSSSSSQPEAFIIDISTKTGSRPVVGTADTGTMNPNGI